MGDRSVQPARLEREAGRPVPRVQAVLLAAFLSAACVVTVGYTAGARLVPVALACFGTLLLLGYARLSAADAKKALAFVVATSFFVYFEPAPTDILAATALAGFFAGRLFRGKPPFAADRTTFLLLALAGVTWLGSVVAGLTGLSVVYATISLYLVLFCIFVREACTTDESVSRLAWWYVFPAIVTSLIMLLALAAFAHPFLQWIGSLLANLQEPVDTQFSLRRGTWICANFRSVAFFKCPNVAGAFLVPALLLTLSSAALEKRRRGLLIGASALLTLGVGLSFSRGAYLNLAVGLCFALFSFRKLPHFPKLPLLMIFLVLPACLVPSIMIRDGSFEQRLEAKQLSPDYEHRLGRFLHGFELLWAHPLAGTGIRSLPEQPHDSYVANFSMYGLPGGLVHLAFLILLARKSAATALADRDPRTRIVSTVLAASLLGLLAEGFFHGFLHWRHFWLLAGLSLALARIREGGEQVTAAAEPGAGSGHGTTP